MEFRIKLYLYHFFIDYQKMCYVYIKENTKTVEDLIHYISKHFKIEGEFYLTSNDFYVPHFEDIRVLKEDEVVVAVPQPSTIKQIVEKRKASKNPKQVKKNVAPEPIEKFEKLQDEHTKVAVKKRIMEEDFQMLIDESDVDEVDRGKKNRNGKKTIKCEDNNESWKNVAHEYTRKRKIDPLPISTLPNIVKTIIVQKNSSNGLEIKSASNESRDSDTSTSSSKIDVESTIESEVVKVKNKRKRVRKRRKPVHNGPLPKIESPKIPILGQPTVHIRFEDVAEASVDTDVIRKEKEPEEIIELEKDKFKNVNYEVLCKSEIVNFPLMKDRFPNPDDVIAFKRYKLSEAFTPEISNYIIGRVLNFCSESKNVFVKILEGLDECKDPEGKFFCSLDEKHDVSDENQFVWTELIEPRLLFP